MGQTPKHTPVLLREVLSYLAPANGETYLDATAGYGGHADAILERTLQDKGSVLVDRDEQAIAELQQRFAGRAVDIRKGDFLLIAQQLVAEGASFDLILADLGVSSVHLDNASRGFSFNDDGPLDMRMDRSQSLNAANVVNSYSRDALMDIIRSYGEEPKAARVASAIVEHRPIHTTHQLAQIVTRALKGGGKKRPWGNKSHPATKTFQALRIAVNSELDQLERALPLWEQLLEPGGRLGIISFHSLEDRIVKRYFAQQAADIYDADLRHITKKPITAERDEIVSNPRARSAKLRVVAKINTKRKEH